MCRSDGGKKKIQKNRALQTCSTHQTVYTILVMSTFIMVILHRFPELSDHRSCWQSLDICLWWTLVFTGCRLKKWDKGLWPCSTVETQLLRPLIAYNNLPIWISEFLFILFLNTFAIKKRLNLLLSYSQDQVLSIFLYFSILNACTL